MEGYHFVGGIHYFLQSAAPQFPSLLESFKRESPETNGRGVNFIFVDPFQIGRTWKEESNSPVIIQHPCTWKEGLGPSVIVQHTTKAKLRQRAHGFPDDCVKDIETRIDQYNADEELLFCFCAGELVCTITARIPPTQTYK